VVDGVILVATGGRTPKIALQRAKDALLQVNAKILGVVINRVNIHQADYNDYYYRYQYYYGEGAPKKELPYKVQREGNLFKEGELFREIKFSPVMANKRHGA